MGSSEELRLELDLIEKQREEHEAQQAAQKLRKIELHKPGNMVPIPLRDGETIGNRKKRLKRNWTNIQPSLRGAEGSPFLDTRPPMISEVVTWCAVSREELEEDLVDRAVRHLQKHGPVVANIIDVQTDEDEEGILLIAYAEVEG